MQVNPFVVASSPVREKKEVTSEVWEKSTAVDEELQYSP